MKVVVIQRHETDSWDPGTPVFMAVADSKPVAKRWIQDEVDGKHSTSHSYMTGKTAEWWIERGTFSLTSVTLQRTTFV